MSEYGEGWKEIDGDVLPPEDSEVFKGYPFPDTTEYMFGAVEAERLVTSDSEPVKENGPKKLEPAERLAMTSERFAFYPLSQRELSDVIDLTAKELPGGAATHLNIVFKRQAGYMEDPSLTIRSIVTRYYTYAHHAGVEASLLKALSESVGDVPARTRISTLSSISLWKHEPSVWRPLMAILQERDIVDYTKDDLRDVPLEPDSDKKLRLYTISNPTTTAQLEQMITTMKVGELKDSINETISRHAHRFNFWVKALEESRSHMVARPTAYNALVKLKVIEQT